MLGTIIGDIAGSTREKCIIKTEEMELFPSGSHFTGITVMTLAVAKWLMEDASHSAQCLSCIIQEMVRKYPNVQYDSYDNASALWVSPVGLYANSLNEALEFAKIIASASNDNMDGIKGAQAVAACVWMKKNRQSCIKNYIEETFNYNLDISLEDYCNKNTLALSDSNNVSVAIMASLQCYHADKSLHLALSMGQNSHAIGCMTTAIADTFPLHYIPQTDFSQSDIATCRSLLSPYLLDINDRFEVFISKPLYQSYYVNRNVYAGEYPGDKDEKKAKSKIQHMLHFGVRHFIDLTEEGELRPYSQLLPAEVTYKRFPIHDCSVPNSLDVVEHILRYIKNVSKRDDGYVYIHCWGGVGRTGTIIACYMELDTYQQTIKNLRYHFSFMPKSAHRVIPDTEEQNIFIRKFVDSKAEREQQHKKLVQDSIRGCLMGGAAGDALGYPVEFMNRNAILLRYGKHGITQFDIDSNGKALVSDDTQMTLFTANGMLMGLTRGCMRGIGGEPECYVNGAYVDWYYTQTGIKSPTVDGNDFHYTWLRDLPSLAHRRAPGNTCLSACASLLNNTSPHNNSKGCGGIMRVAPMGLLDASYQLKNGEGLYSTQRLAAAGAKIAQVTHLHPLGFMPASLLTLLISRLVPLSPNEVRDYIDDIIQDGLQILMQMYSTEYANEMELLKSITMKAVQLAHSDTSDAESIKLLGEGWVAEEALAISLYCAIRHIYNIREAIIAAVNHDGDSDSTGSITGQIMGAIYGYETIKKEHLFCPNNRTFESTIELADIILTLADDLYTGCIISEYDPIDTPEKQQWYKRYCEMEPAGLK